MYVCMYVCMYVNKLCPTPRMRLECLNPYDAKRKWGGPSRGEGVRKGVFFHVPLAVGGTGGGGRGHRPI